MDIGRNQPCYCGSGKKYKKCCLRKDEDVRRDAQDMDEFEYALRKGLIDPFAADEDWEEETTPGGFDDDYVDASEDDFEFEDWHDDELEDESAIPPNYLHLDKRDHLSAIDIECIESWWDDFEEMSESEELLAHITLFLDKHPSLVKDLGLEDGPMYSLEDKCCDRHDYQNYFDLISRLHREFPKAYEAGFAGYDRFMVLWLLSEGKKEYVTEYLQNFKKNTDDSQEELPEVINILASSNCQDILEDFLPDVLQEVKQSHFIMEGEDIIHPVITLILAPFLDNGLKSFQVQELVKKLEPLSDLLSSSWLDEDALQRKVERLLGVEGTWRLEDCTTRLKAIELYEDVACRFMGWLHSNKSLDWCTAGYFSLHMRSYFYEALPAKKRPRVLFPVQAHDIALMFQRFNDQYYFPNTTEMLGMVNSLFWFADFLLELQLVDQEQAESAQETCRELFKLIKGKSAQTDCSTLLWKTLPREY